MSIEHCALHTAHWVKEHSTAVTDSDVDCNCNGDGDSVANIDACLCNSKLILEGDLIEKQKEVPNDCIPCCDL